MPHRTMNAAHRARTRKQQGGQRHPEMDARNRHLILVTPAAPEPGTSDDQPGAGAEARDPVPPAQSVADAESRWDQQIAYALRRAQDYSDPFLALGQSLVAAALAPSSQSSRFEAGDRSSAPLVVHPQWRGRLEREHREWLLRRSPDDSWLVWRPRSSRLERSGHGADDGSGASIPRFRLLARLARGAVAQYVAALSRLRVGGPTRVW